MDLVNNNGLTQLSIEVSGVRIEPMVRVASSMSTEISMMDTGQTIKLMEWVSTSMSMEHSMKACGRTIYNMDMEWRHGPISPSMKVNMHSDVSTE